MSLPMRRASSTSAASNRSISSARDRSTGSPYLRTSRSAASRRARVSGSSLSWGSATCPCASVCTSSDMARDSRSPGRVLGGVDVNGKVHIAERLVAGGGLDGRPDRGDRVRARRRLEHQLVALAVAQAKQWCRAEQLGVVHLDLLREAGGGGAGAGGVLERGGDDPDQVRERRIAPAATAFELVTKEAVG